MKIIDRVNPPRNLSKGKKLAVAGLLALASVSANVSADEAKMLDCPLRDAPYSVDLPFIEMLLKPEAKAVVNKHMAGLADKMPPNFASTETPTFATIVSLRSMSGMGGQTDPKVLETVNAELAKLEITDADRRARCARYDDAVPEFEQGDSKVNVLVFTKINGFDHGPSVTAATHAIQSLGEQMGWGVAVTDMPGAFNPLTLAKFNAVIWNNNSGDVLTVSQQKAFEDYINNGGGFLGIHGAGGDFLYLWDWYADTLLGARFIGHPMEPQFQDARINVETNITGIGESLAPDWVLNDEWYSFRQSPRDTGATVIATLDETTYSPVGRGGQNVRMGDDHPIAWSRCIGEGRSFYSAIGHRPEVYGDARHLQLLEQGILWSAGKENSACTAYNQEGK